MNLRRYQSHKIVNAGKILHIYQPGITIGVEQADGTNVTVSPLPAGFVRPGTEMRIGDYYVVYEDGYTSLSPKAAFEGGYMALEPVDPKTTGLTFGEAIAVLKVGGRVARAGWNGKGMFLFLVPGSRFKVNRPPLLGIYEEGTEIDYHAHIDMKTAQGYVVPWLASQADMLADDWMLVAE